MVEILNVWLNKFLQSVKVIAEDMQLSFGGLDEIQISSLSVEDFFQTVTYIL